MDILRLVGLFHQCPVRPLNIETYDGMQNMQSCAGVHIWPTYRDTPANYLEKMQYLFVQLRLHRLHQYELDLLQQGLYRASIHSRGNFPFVSMMYSE